MGGFACVMPGCMKAGPVSVQLSNGWIFHYCLKDAKVVCKLDPGRKIMNETGIHNGV